ncbi:C40 family peptidase [Leifsonia virtsii]|uniref:C40 family peptidase n=1 Tax=Leifsonia virtsii TaxID=3035915 RepID=A0ABT8IYM8_9MICO|nr:C40 family peptidase [Leifsonia virtsii]MDN4597926.1 C40 family peptidase [Leifsonia virtsii]
MTVTDAIGRIAQIQATLVQLDSAGKTAATGSASGTSASSGTSATDFASALSGALGATQGTSTGSVTGADVVADAKKYLGVPYVFGGTSASGLDCSGLVQRVFKDLGIDVPRLVSGQSTVGTEVPSLAQAQPGDLIVTNGGEHIVIYAGDGKVIHAPSEGRNVSLVDNWMKDSDIVTIRRVAPQAAPAASGASALSGSTAKADMLRSLFASMTSGGSL